MANGPDPWRDPRTFVPHAHGERIDGVLHRCPDCPIGHPDLRWDNGQLLGRPGCRTCLGAGDVTEQVLDVWVARTNAQAARSAT